jgi:rhomboid protease GluP
MAAEHAYGKIEMAVVYLLSGLAGGLFSVLTSPGPSVGASGAIFGILGLMIVFFVKYHHGIHLRDRRVGNVLLLWAGYSVVTAFFIPFIDNAAHVGGLIAGAFCGYFLTPRLLKGIAVPEHTFALESQKRGRG